MVEEVTSDHSHLQHWDPPNAVGFVSPQSPLLPLISSIYRLIQFNFKFNYSFSLTFLIYLSLNTHLDFKHISFYSPLINYMIYKQWYTYGLPRCFLLLALFSCSIIIIYICIYICHCQCNRISNNLNSSKVKLRIITDIKDVSDVTIW